MGEKIMLFVIPEMPSKTFVIVSKKLPDHFNREEQMLVLGLTI